MNHLPVIHYHPDIAVRKWINLLPSERAEVDVQGEDQSRTLEAIALIETRKDFQMLLYSFQPKENGEYKGLGMIERSCITDYRQV